MTSTPPKAPDATPAAAPRLTPLLHALFFVAAATQSAIVPLLPRLSHVYHLSPSTGALLLVAPGRHAGYPLELHHAGFSAGATGVAFSAAAGLYIAVSALVVRLGRRATTTRFAAVAGLALAVSLLPAVFDSATVALVGVVVLSTIPRAVVSTVAYPLATDSAARARLADGLVIGLLNGTWATGLVLAPLLAGTVDELAGPGAAFLVTTVPAALIAVWLLARPQTARSDHPTGEHKLAATPA